MWKRRSSPRRRRWPPGRRIPACGRAAIRLRWRHLLRFHDSGPAVLLFNDGSAGLLVGANAAHKVVFIKDPVAPEGEAAVPVDELRLAEVWSGEAVLLRANRGVQEADAPFSVRWLVGLVLRERRSLRDIGFASLTMSFLTIFPPLIVMTVVDRCSRTTATRR